MSVVRSASRRVGKIRAVPVWGFTRTTSAAASGKHRSGSSNPAALCNWNAHFAGPGKDLVPRRGRQPGHRHEHLEERSVDRTHDSTVETASSTLGRFDACELALKT